VAGEGVDEDRETDVEAGLEEAGNMELNELNALEERRLLTSPNGKFDDKGTDGGRFDDDVRAEVDEVEGM
jgi:hypothetical protein